jgi:hypothetical protein
MAYTHFQEIPQQEWNITHDLDTLNPVVDTWIESVDGTTIVIPLETRVIDSNKIRISFSQDLSGHAFINN